MCGITGWLEHRERNPADCRARVEEMLEAMRQRGPDDRGVVEIHPRTGGWLWLGACRLAILDLSPAGHQPAQDPETGNRVVHNGEVFNFRELRRELETHGCVFRSNCDTEVILLGYRVWGEGLIERLRGMYAFAVWDEAEQKLLLVRDRLGIKPVYFARKPQGLLFASEVRALLRSGEVSRRLNPCGVDSYLKFGAVQEPVTLIEGIELLPAGHRLRWQSGRLEVERYWNLPAGAPTNGNGHAVRERIAEVHQTLRDAVRMRLVSDVPLGVFLSGGLDSSVVAALASECRPGLRTFTINFEEKRHSEGVQARQVAEYLGSEHCETTVSQRHLLEALSEALAAMDQPTVDGINTYFVSRATKQAGVTVALSGLGGDELFAGYRSFRAVPRMERLEQWTPRGWRRFAGRMLGSSGTGAERERKIAAWLSGEDGFGHPFFVSRLVLTPRRVAQVLQPEWLLAMDYSPLRPQWEETQALLEFYDPVNRVACLELTTYLRNMLLRDTDCMSMAHSLEVRVPLIDHVLVEKMMRLPGPLKLNRHQRKPLLVGAPERPLPASILRQPKRGFEFPWDAWLRGELRREAEETLAEPANLAAVLRWERVREMWREFLAGRLHWSRVWVFYVLRKWAERHAAA